MIVKKVKLQGNDNILLYGIHNQADIMNDLELLDFITADTVVLVTLSDVNFYELCRLSHHYREKIRVVQEDRIGNISEDYFSQMFPGEFKNTQTEEMIKTGDIVREACDRFMDLVLQMQADEDIIPPWAGKLFIPMLYRHFTVTVPISFYDFVLCLKGTKMENVFKDENYQENIDNTLFAADGTEVLNNIILMFFKLVTTEIDSERSSQLIKVIKFRSLGNNETKKLYHFSPIGFSKYNELMGFDQRVSFFNGNPEKISEQMKSLAGSKTPLKVDFAVQLPLHQLQVLERTFPNEDLKVDFISKPREIIGNGIRFEDFVVAEYDEGLETREQLIVEHAAAVSAYRERIKSASENALAALALLLDIKGNARTSISIYGPSGLVTLLPAIATTKAVLTLDSSKEPLYRSMNDELNKSMLYEMLYTMFEINKSINQTTVS